VKQRIEPGASVDFLTPAEATSMLAELAGELAAPAEDVRVEADGTTNAAGALTFELFKVPTGQRARLVRLLVFDDAHSLASPFTGAGAELRVLRNDVIVDGVTLTTAPGLPAILTEGITSAAVFMNGDSCQIQIVAGPATTHVLARGQFRLEPLGREPGATPYRPNGARRQGPGYR
jgi:hypothetical protein